MALNIVGLGLGVAGVLFMAFLGPVGFVIGLICMIGGVGALWNDVAAQATRACVGGPPPVATTTSS